MRVWARRSHRFDDNHAHESGRGSRSFGADVPVAQGLDPQLLDDATAQGNTSTPDGEDYTPASVVQDRHLAAHAQSETQQSACELTAAADLGDTGRGAYGKIEQRHKV